MELRRGLSADGEATALVLTAAFSLCLSPAAAARAQAPAAPAPAQPRGGVAELSQTIETGTPEQASTPDPVSQPPPKRPVILFNRWQENWSALADPALRTEPGDELKYIPLDPAEKTWLTLGAGSRARYENITAQSFSIGGGRGDGYVISRNELLAQAYAGKWMGFVEIQSDYAPGKRILTAVDSDRFDVEQAFVSYTGDLGPGQFSFRAGRQQFAFDLQRFVSARNGPNVQQSFDALWSGYKLDGWKLVAYFTRPVINVDHTAFDDHSNSHNLFYGARLERDLGVNGQLAFYWSRFRQDFPRYLFATGREERDVYDLHWSGKRVGFDWDAEGMYQGGRVGPKQVRAWAVGWEGGYTVPVAWKPRAGVQVDAASGDRHPNDNVLGTFNPLFPNGAYLNLAGFTGYVNFIHLKPSVTVTPVKGLQISAAYAGHWRMTTSDAVYTQPDIPVPLTAGRGERWTGTNRQLRLDWSVTSNFSLAVESDHFAIGSTLKTAGGRDGEYLSVEADAHW